MPLLKVSTLNSGCGGQKGFTKDLWKDGRLFHKHRKDDLSHRNVRHAYSQTIRCKFGSAKMTRPLCPDCGIKQLTELRTEALRRTWADDEGVKWWLRSGAAYWRLCELCHAQRWPLDRRCANRHSRPGAAVDLAGRDLRQGVSRLVAGDFYLTQPPPLRSSPPAAPSASPPATVPPTARSRIPCGGRRVTWAWPVTAAMSFVEASDRTSIDLAKECDSCSSDTGALRWVSVRRQDASEKYSALLCRDCRSSAW